MAINKSYISTNPTERYGGSVIEMLASQPPVSGILDQPMAPGRMVGYYDGNSDTVFLYVVSGSGLRVVRVS